jgi:hypothetical protein
LKRALIAIGLAALLVGCGGGGSGSGSVGSNLVSLFITDSLDGNDHVWVTVKSVDLQGAGGATNVFSNAAGVTVDLKTLRDATGARFQFLNQDTVPAGTYTGAKVTLAKDLVVFPHLAGVGTPMTFDNQYDDGSGNSLISFNFEHPHTVGAGSDEVVVDFDLAHWDETGGVVTVSLKEGSKQGIDNSDRHESIHYAGTVADLAGGSPSFTFHLNHHTQQGFPVSTDANTTFFQSDGQPAVLANGKDVIVDGSWDPVSGTLVAKSVRVLTAEDEQGEDANAEGPVTEFSLVNGFIRISTHEAEGFVPLANSVRIEFTDTTVFVAGDNAVTKDEFFALLAAGDELEADGSYNPGTFVLTASHVHLHHEGGDGGGTSGGSTGETTGSTGGSTGETTGTTGDTTGGSTGQTTGTTGDTTTGTTGTTGDATTGTTGTTGDSTTGTTGTTGDATTGTTGTTGDATTGTTGTTGDATTGGTTAK